MNNISKGNISTENYESKEVLNNNKSVIDGWFKEINREYKPNESDK